MVPVGVNADVKLTPLAKELRRASWGVTVAAGAGGLKLENT
jgi:hypothetical protein